MTIQYDVPRLRRILNDLMMLTGIGLAFLDTEYRFLCKCTKEDSFCAIAQQERAFKDKCLCSDELLLRKSIESRRVECHLCHVGLFDAAMPIVKDGVLVGFVILGRIRSPQSCLPSEYMADPAKRTLWMGLPSYTDEQLDSLKSLLPNVLLGNAIEIKYSELAQEVSEFIERHLSEKLSLESLCAQFYVSKNTLYKLFRENFACTVNEYIITCRIRRACYLLRNSDMPVGTVAETVGIDNYPYFCRIFRARVGMTPGEYRRS